MEHNFSFDSCYLVGSLFGEIKRICSPKAFARNLMVFYGKKRVLQGRRHMIEGFVIMVGENCMGQDQHHRLGELRSSSA